MQTKTAPPRSIPRWSGNLRKCLAEDVDEDTSSDGGTDNTGHVGAHCVHQQEVGGVLALADLLRNTGSHRHSGNASGTDQGVDLTAGQNIHDLAAENTGSGAEGEGDEAQHDDEQGAAVQEGVCRGGTADRQSQEDGDDVHQLIAGGLLDTIHDAALLHQVAQHQHTDQNGGIRHDEGDDDGDHDGEDDPLGLGHGAQLLHHDGTLLFGGQGLHDGGWMTGTRAM